MVWPAPASPVATAADAPAPVAASSPIGFVAPDDSGPDAVAAVDLVDPALEAVEVAPTPGNAPVDAASVEADVEVPPVVAPLNPPAVNLGEADGNTLVGGANAVDESGVSAAVPVPVLPPNNPGPATVTGGHDPLVSLVELEGTQFAPVTHWYRTAFDPSRLRLAHTSGGAQLLIAVDPTNEMELEASTPSGTRGVGIQVTVPTTVATAQTDPIVDEPCPSLEGSVSVANDPASVSTDGPVDDVSTLSSGAAQLEHQQFVAARELTK